MTRRAYTEADRVETVAKLERIESKAPPCLADDPGCNCKACLRYLDLYARLDAIHADLGMAEAV